MVVMVFPVVFVLLMKYDPGSAALVAALGSMSAQEFRIMQENNPPLGALLKFIGNRAVTALRAFAAWGAFNLVYPHDPLNFGDPVFILASAAAGIWVIVRPHSEPPDCAFRPFFRLSWSQASCWVSAPTLPSVVGADGAL